MIDILAFEGPDKVGKSTLIRKLNSETNYRYLCIDRFLASAWVYDSLTGRRERDQEIIDSEKELGRLACTNLVNVIVTCERAILADRIQHEDEEPEARLRNLDRMIELYDRYMDITQLPFIKVDTTDRSIDESVQEIIGKLHAYDTK